MTEEGLFVTVTSTPRKVDMRVKTIATHLALLASALMLFHGQDVLGQNISNITVSLQPVGPTTETNDLLKAILLASPSFQTNPGPNAILVNFQLLDDSGAVQIRPDTGLGLVNPGRKMSRYTGKVTFFRATIYDWDNRRTLIAEGPLSKLTRPPLAAVASGPEANQAEFDMAVNLLSTDPDWGPRIQSGELTPHTTVPPVFGDEQADGSVDCFVAVELQPTSLAATQYVVGVSLAGLGTRLFQERAPITFTPTNGQCGFPDCKSNITATARGSSGQARLTIFQGTNVLWTMVVIRPSASSGTKGSGIELRDVKFKGKLVLYQAHVPILNVKYDGDKDGCGPYRDWQWEEGKFQAVGADPVPGFRVCPAPATTIFDTGNDCGNFNGVAIYVSGSEVVLVTELDAGWYRYISQWRFDANGTIRPRFGFTAVKYRCVCNIHHHHVYWRLDFDIEGAANDYVQEYNNPPIIGIANWTDTLSEIKRLRDSTHNRKWRVLDRFTGRGYEIIPGSTDGSAFTSTDWDFGQGDFWVLRYHPGEIDDGETQTVVPDARARAHIDNFNNGESVLNKDVVLWYSGTFSHDFSLETSHIVGPDLVPINW